jgi:hypothetical protein
MWQSQIGQRPGTVSTFPTRARYAIWPSDDETKIPAIALPIGQVCGQLLARHLLTTLIEQYDLLIRTQLVENAYAFCFASTIRLVTLSPSSGWDGIQAKFPLARISTGVNADGFINPGWLTITDSDESDMHDLPVGSRKIAR